MNKPIIVDINKLVEEYNSEMTTEELAKQYKTDRHVILGLLSESGCRMRSFGESQKLRYKKTGHPSSGRKHSEEVRTKMSKNHADFSGKNNPNYRNGNFSGGGKIFEKWRELILERDNYICRICHCRDKIVLITHHIIGWNSSIERRYDITNGITLCNCCHGKITKRGEKKFVKSFSAIINESV